MAFLSNQVLTVADSVATLTVPSTGHPTGAILSVEDAPIRLTLDGSTPNNTTKNGIKLSNGAIFEVSGTRDLQNLKMIRADASDASVSVNYQQKD